MAVWTRRSPKPSPLAALVALAIVAEFRRDWVARNVRDAAGGVGVSSERVSRIKAKVLPRIEEEIATATRRGRPPAVPPAVAADPVTDELLAVAAAALRDVHIPRHTADRIVAAAARLREQHGLTRQDFCARLGLNERTLRFWKRRPARPPAPVPAPPPPPAPKPDRNEGRFGLDVTVPGIQTMSDTTDWNVFGVDLKVTAAMDPGDRHRQPWQAFAVEAAETAEVVVDAVGRAITGAPGTQVITDQGTPFLAELSRAAYDAMHADHAPCVEGRPTDKAPLERSFLDIKRLLEPIADLTRKLADLLPALRRPDIACPAAALLLATHLRIFELGHRHLPHPLDGADPQRLRDIADEQREKAHREFDSKKMLLGQIFDGLQCTGSRDKFIRSLRHHHIEDIQAAQRSLAQNWWCCCRVRSPNRYFAKVLWNAALAGRERRDLERARRTADANLKRRHRADVARETFLVQHPDELLRHGLDVVLAQTRSDFGRDLLRANRGPGPSAITRAVDLLRSAEPFVHLDTVESTWSAWRGSLPPNDAPLADAARRILDVRLNKSRDHKSPLTTPTAGGKLPLRARENHPRPP